VLVRDSEPHEETKPCGHGREKLRASPRDHRAIVPGTVRLSTPLGAPMAERESHVQIALEAQGLLAEMGEPGNYITFTAPVS